MLDIVGCSGELQNPWSIEDQMAGCRPRAAFEARSIAGHCKDSPGILSNPFYIGALLYGRTETVTEPVTWNNRVARDKL